MKDCFAIRPAVALLLLLAVAAPAAAQEPTLEDYRDRLPEQTVFCLSWQNLSDLEALRATNPVLRLLASPEMKTNWEALEDYNRRRDQVRSGDAKPTPSSARPAADRARDFAQLLTNPGFVALVAPPASSDSAAPRPEPETIFLYDLTGKEELIARLNAEDRKPGEKRSTYEFEGLTVEETLNPEGKPRSYQTRLGRWLVEGSEKASFEAWLRAMREPPARSLSGSAAYQRAQGLWSPGSQVRGFLNVSLLMENLRALPPTKPGDPSAAEVLEALDLARWELLTFDAAADADTLRYQATGQQGGDPPGLLGILGAPVADFPSLRLAPSSSTSYSTAQIDLAALWGYLQGALDAFIPPPQAGMVQGVLAMAEGLLGMPLDQLMAAWGPEYSQFSYPDAGGALRTVYALSLRQPEQVLAVLRNVVAQDVPFLPVEEIPGPADGESVYFRALSPPGEKGELPKPFLHLAVTGNWLLASERKEDLEAALARAGGGSPHLSQSPVYQQARNRFPGPLSGFGFVDAERWLETDAAKKILRAILEGAAGASAEPQKKTDGEEKDPDADSDADPDADGSAEAAEDPAQEEEPHIPLPELQIPRGYLKWLISATTRDTRSFRFVGIVE